MFFLNLLSFALSTWLGMFMLARGTHPRLRLTAWGLLFYAAALIINIPGVSLALRLLPPIFWVGSILHLDQHIIDNHPIMHKLWMWFLIPVTILLGGFFLIDSSASQDFPYLWVSLFIGLTPLLWTFILIQDYKTFFQPRQVLGILFTATIFFGLGEVFLLFPADWFPREYILPAIGLDLLLLGFCIAWFDAFDEGETFLPDMIRSLVLTSVIVLIFTGQVGFVITIQTGLTEGMKILLITTALASIFMAVFGSSLQNLLDGIAFSRNSSIRDERRRLVTESNILSRKDAGIDLSKLNEDERSHLTRRALSHFGNLNRLASNPLTRLPAIELRMKERNIPDTTLDRANELKLVLTESILKLKPQVDRDFDTTDEWRFYNALFFPYVTGLRPYSRTQGKELAGFEKNALEWFQSFVPERTLHNGQNTAARLIANDLWEKNF
jgi:hypothetical protein